MDTVPSWLPTDLDLVSSDWSHPMLYPCDSLLRLPSELLLQIAEYLCRDSLYQLTLTCSCLCKIAEDCLYREIFIPKYGGWTDKRERISIFHLNRTLSESPRLGSIVKTLDIVIDSFHVEVPVTASGILPYARTISANTTVRIRVPFVAGSLLLSMPAVETLSIALRYGNRGYPPYNYVHDSFQELFGKEFDPEASNSILMNALGHVKSLNFEGLQFHWVLAKLPSLEHLTLNRSCRILPDQSPLEVSASIKSLTLPCFSSVLIRGSERYKTCAPFLQHLPFLQTVKIPIRDVPDNIDEEGLEGFEMVNEQRQGSFSVLLEGLKCAASTLKVIDLGLDDDQARYDFLSYALPGGPFTPFWSLKVLKAPYEALLGPEDPSGLLGHPPMEDVLPESLEVLEIHCPVLRILSWLYNFLWHRDRLPRLKRIVLHCRSDRGDSYVEFAYHSYPHPVFNGFRRAGISIELRYLNGDWQCDWDDYDVQMTKMLEWFQSLGDPYRGK